MYSSRVWIKQHVPYDVNSQQQTNHECVNIYLMKTLVRRFFLFKISLKSMLHCQYSGLQYFRINMNSILFSSNNICATLKKKNLQTFNTIICMNQYVVHTLSVFFFFFSKSSSLHHVSLIQSSVIEVNGCVRLLGDGKAIPSVFKYVCSCLA